MPIGTPLVAPVQATTTGTTTSQTLTIPSGAAAGDFAVVVGNVGAGTGITMSGPSGWTQLVNQTIASNNGKLGVWVKELVAGDPGSTVTVTASAARGMVSDLLVAPLGDYGSITSVTVQTGATNITIPGATPAVADSLLIGITSGAASVANSPRSFTAPSGWTKQVDQFTASTSAGRPGIAVFTKQLSGQAGVAQAAATAVCSGTYDSLAVTIVAAPGAALTSRAVTPATEAATAPTVARTKTAVLQPTAGTATALTLGRVKTRAVAAATEIAAAVGLARRKTQAATPATEGDTAAVIGRGKQRSLPITLEQDSSLAAGRRKTRPVTAGAESDTAAPVSNRRPRTLTAAIEIATATVVARRKTRTITPVSEVTTAPPAGRVRSRVLHAALEASTAIDVARSKLNAAATAAQADTATPLRAARARLLQVALEVDQAFTIARRPPPCDITVTIGAPVARRWAVGDEAPGRRVTIGAAVPRRWTAQEDA